MWFVFTILTFLFWGIADLFYKEACDYENPRSHLETTIIVGLTMGICGIATLLVTKTPFHFMNLIIYLPVSCMYILSMLIGYYGLRYLLLSVSSPIQNSSGALTYLLLVIFLHKTFDCVSVTGVILITLGIMGLGACETYLNSPKTGPQNKHYHSSLLALGIPIVYCLLDAIGTFFDGWYLDDYTKSPLIGATEENLEIIANASYQLTFLLVALLLLGYLRLKHHYKMSVFASKVRLGAALFETVGQYSYVYAMSGNSVIAAPVIASYSACSVILARMILKERLTNYQWISLLLIFAGMAILGLMENQ